MIRRFLLFIFVLAIALGALYFWWQHNATIFITAQVQEHARDFFANPQGLQVENAPVLLKSLNSAGIAKLVISGKNLSLHNGPKLASAKLVLTDVQVSRLPFRITSVGSGYYAISVTDTDVTQYLRKRNEGLRTFAKIPTDTITVKFAKANTTLTGHVIVPLINKKVPLTASGKLVPASKDGQIDLNIKQVRVHGWDVGARKVTDALAMLNPVVDVSEWPITSDITAIRTGNGTLTFRGQVTGVQASLLP